MGVVDRFRPGDIVSIHSFDHRVQYNMHILDVNTSADPIYLDAVFLPVYPVDLELPAMLPQALPRYTVRQAPGSGLFCVIDSATGQAVHDNGKDRGSALEMAAQLERALAATGAQIAADASRRTKRGHLAEVE